MKTKEIASQDIQVAGVMVSLEVQGDTSLRLLDSVSTYLQLYAGLSSRTAEAFDPKGDNPFRAITKECGDFILSVGPRVYTSTT